MKSTFAFFSCVVGLAVMVGCGGSDSPATTNLGGTQNQSGQSGQGGQGGQAGQSGEAGVGGLNQSGQAGSSGGGAGSAGTTSGPYTKADNCQDKFGNALTDSFGRLDGKVVALVRPLDTQCPLVNDDHLVIQLMMNGAVYRMVVNVADIGYAEKDAPLKGEPWSEGWHTTVKMDYPSDFDIHAADFTTYPMNDLVMKIVDQIEVNDQISVYAVSSGGSYASSAHLVHRNNVGFDGGIALHPTAESTHYLLFRFDNQKF
jgi:putative lipoic acid-binding regulatory protein